jgi:hypothetical protein
MKKITTIMVMSFYMIALCAQTNEPVMVNVIKFADGSAAYCKNLESSNGRYTLSGIVGTEKVISVNLPDELKSVAGRLNDISGSGGHYCIECDGNTGICFWYITKKLTDIQNQILVNDGNLSVLNSNSSGIVLHQDGIVKGASGRGDCSITQLPANTNIDLVVNSSTSLGLKGALGAMTSIQNYGHYFCVDCDYGPGWCFVYLKDNTPTNHDDLHWVN